MDHYLQSDGEDEEDKWRFSGSTENCILCHVHQYGQMYKTGRMKDDDILSQAAAMMQPTSSRDAVDDGCMRSLGAVWVVTLHPLHRWVLSLRTSQPPHLNGTLYEWFQGRLIHQGEVQVRVNQQYGEVDSVSQELPMRRVLEWCMHTATYGIVRCVGALWHHSECESLHIETCAGTAVQSDGMRRHQDHFCHRCGNIDSFDHSRQEREGVVVCTRCGVCLEHNLHEGEAHRNFSGEEDRNHHGKWNPLFSDSYNMQTFQGSGGDPRKRRSGGAAAPRRLQSSDAYKDQQKKEAFDIIEAMSYTTGHRYHLTHICVEAPVPFPGISYKTLQCAKHLFAQRRIDLLPLSFIDVGFRIK